MLLSGALNMTKMKFNILWDLKPYIWWTRDVPFNLVLQYLSYLILKTACFIATEHLNVQKHIIEVRNSYFLKGSLLPFTHECVV